MTFLRFTFLALGGLALGALVAACSGAPGTTGFAGSDDGGGEQGDAGHPSNGSSGGGTPASTSSGGGSSGTAGTSGSSSGGGSGTASSSGSSGGSGSTSGGSSGASASGASSGGSSGGGSTSGSSGGASSSGGSSGAAMDAGAAHDATADAVAEAGVGSDAGICADQAVWLTPMNAARAAVNANEPPLVCDPIAAQVALNYAKQCNYQHNANRNANYTALGGAASGLGENIAAGAPTESIAAAVQSWISEQTNYDHATNTCATGQMCGHYTQIVWKSTTGVGCAHVSCTTNSPFGSTGGGMWDFSVCDYSPPGNYVGQPPY